MKPFWMIVIGVAVIVVLVLLLQRFVYPVGLGAGYLETDPTLQKLLNGFSCSKTLSFDSVIRLDLFDGNGKVVEKYSIIGRSVKRGEAKNYDVYVATGKYYLKDLENSDVCTVVNKIIANKDYYLSRGTVMKAVAMNRAKAAMDCAINICGLKGYS